MTRPPPMPNAARIDVCSLEADMAFFEARLSFAGDAPDTAYQRAQIKTYQTLGSQLAATLEVLRAERKAAASAKKKGGHAAA